MSFGDRVVWVIQHPIFNFTMLLWNFGWAVFFAYKQAHSSVFIFLIFTLIFLLRWVSLRNVS